MSRIMYSFGFDIKSQLSLEVSRFTPDSSYILFKSAHFAESAQHELNATVTIYYND